MRTPSPDFLRLCGLGAAIGPVIAAFIAWDSRSTALSALWQKPMLALALSALVGTACVLLIRYAVEKPLSLWMRRRQIHVGWITLVAALASVVILLSFCGLLIVAFGLPTSGDEALRSMAGVSGFVGFTVLGATSIDGLLRSQHNRQQTLAAQSQARALESQINPHFFFNTLNTINALIPEDPDAAQRSVRQLAELFRYSLQHDGEAIIPLAREIAFVQQYLEIEKARFGNRLRFTLPDPDRLHGLQVPRLTLQPLVENAIRHGIAPRLDGGDVTVGLDLQPHRYLLEITNPVDGRLPPEASFFQKGHALHMVRERLRLLYGGKAALRVVPATGHVTVQVEVPRNPAKEAACAR
jgi:two-component system sensor histidine kinase AlgZ